jgi:hypothetical protein
MSFSVSRVARVFCLCLLLCLFSAPILADAQILIEPTVGFHGVFQLGRAFPLDIELSNTGRPVEGILEVRVWKGGVTKAGAPYPLYYRKEIFLSAQSKKTIQFTIDPDFISRPLTITFTSPAGKSSRELDLRRHFSPVPVILFISGGNTAPAIALGPSSQNRLVSLTLAELPSDSRALLGVSHLLLYDVSLRELSRWQIFALDNWIISGGRLIILGSINYVLYQEPKLSRFLPVRVAGVKKVSSLANLGDAGAISSGTEAWAQTSTVIDGKMLAGDHGIPLLVETGRGKGRITYVALDLGRPPLSRWEGAPKLFRNLLAPVFDSETPPRPHWDDAVFSQLIQSPSFISTYVPAGSLLLVTVAYLMVIGCFLWLWQRKCLPGRILLISFASLVAVFTAGGYLFFSRGGNVPDGVLLTSTVLESVADGFVEAQANVALFSTQVRQYNVQVERGWVDWTPVHSRLRDREDSIVVSQDSSGSNLFQLPLREWDYRLFKARFVERFPLRAEFQSQGDKLLVKIDNQSTTDLTECWLVVPGRRFALGDIPRGAHWSKAFPVAAGTGPEDSGSNRSESVNLRDIPFSDKTRDVLFHSSFFPRDGGERWAGSAAVFFGWVKNPRRRLTVDDPRIRATEYTLFRAIVPLTGSEDDA